ncbi:lycopene cyclase family protein [Lewinella sp. W8]|uniref:lycopene cyclase family protein n=1 Tax=Lewinella sp. W8 TaxID=2528208 RepID=UPI001068967E|nr:lycopene cyclase family protein [Lewinella sp. W8]MTB53983.1 lycopene cyclase [Lewinella sp. W8]
MNHYDIAVLGGGLAGLSLLYHLERARKMDGRKILLVDPEGRKSAHDRTWSFWEKHPGPFEHLVYHRWPAVTVHNDYREVDLNLAPFEYKLIRSTEFYAFVNDVIDARPEVTRIKGFARDVVSEGEGVTFRIDNAAYRADTAFSSIPLHLPPGPNKDYPYLDQHFRGWFIETETDVFDPTTAALMDFRTPQEKECRFFYVLPFSPRRAMVEIAIFSNRHLQREEYDRLLADYIREHWTTAPYDINHTEEGNIPMTTYRFPYRSGNLIYIGMAGGATRPSTGYTFFGLQHQLREVAQRFPDTAPVAAWPRRHILYDAILLRILEEGTIPGSDIFVNLFADNPSTRVFDFLNGESSVLEELKLMSTMDILTFGATFLKEVPRHLVA